MWSATPKIARSDGDFDRGAAQLPPRAAGAGPLAADFSNATDVADYLVARGCRPEAYQLVGPVVVKTCLAKGCLLRDLPLSAGSCCIRPLPPTSTPPSPRARWWRRRQPEGGTGFAQREGAGFRLARVAGLGPRGHCEATTDQGLILKIFGSRTCLAFARSA